MVQICLNILHLVIGYSVSHVSSLTEVIIKLESTVTWYGIANGIYKHAVMLLFIKIEDSWGSFIWYVTIRKSGYQLEQYLQLVISRNIRHGPWFYVGSRFLDFVLNVLVEYSNLKKSVGKVNALVVTKAFDGSGTYRTTTMVQTAHTAMRLPYSVLMLI